MMGIIAAFTSCTNDDITISKATNIKVNPSTVIAPFTFEINTGELETFAQGNKLRVSLLIYNQEGILQAKEVQYLTNYASLINPNINLPYVDYTAIAITDVVEYDDEVTFEFWKLVNEEKLTEAKIEDTGYIASQRGILGIAKKQFTVSEENNKTKEINVEPAGGLFLVTLFNPLYFSDVVRVGALANKTAEHFEFDYQGNFSVSHASDGGDLSWWMCIFDIEDYNKGTTSAYKYYFIPKTNNYKFQFTVITDEDDYIYLDDYSVNINQGDEYLLYLDLFDEEEESPYSFLLPVNGESERANPSSTTDKLLQKIGADEFTKAAVNDGIYLKDVK